MLKRDIDFRKQLRLTSFNHHGTHLCLRLRVHFLLSEQVEVGRHDDLRSLVWSVTKEELTINQKKKLLLAPKITFSCGHICLRPSSLV